MFKLNRISKSIILMVSCLAGILLSEFSATGQTQDQDSVLNYHPYHQTGIGPVIAYRGAREHYLEVGLTRAIAGTGIVGWELTYLNNLNSEQNISGFSVGYFRAFAIFEIGVHSTVYTDFNQYGVGLRPYFGLGIGGVLTLSYGFEIAAGPAIHDRGRTPHTIRAVGRLPVQWLR